MRLFILAGRPSLAQNVAEQLGLPSWAWTFLDTEQQLRGLAHIVVIEEVQTTPHHRFAVQIGRVLRELVARDQARHWRISLDFLYGALEERGAVARR